MNAPGLEDSAPLLFNWEPPRARLGMVIAFIAASVVLHGLCFYIFQIVYPPVVSLLPRPARVTLIIPDSEESRSLLRWVDAEDPALASNTMRPPEARLRGLPRVQHIPSYTAHEAKLRAIPPLVSDVALPSSQPPGAVPVARVQDVPPSAPLATRIKFSEELSAFGPFELPALPFTASVRQAPQELRFRIAVSSSGAVRHCFQINSSGDAALDAQARQRLVLVRFSPPAKNTAPEGALTWGIATFEWGNDVAPASPAPAP